jgi:hypothetical protein
MESRAIFIVASVGLALVLQGCGTISKLAGNKKNIPDEFQVVDKPPLVMPPDYNLRPPKPGEPTPQRLTTSQRTIQSLFPGRTAMPPAPSAGEQALLNKLGAGQVKSDVRTNAGNDTLVVEKGTLLRNILGSEERQNSPDGSEIEKVDPNKKDGG